MVSKTEETQLKRLESQVDKGGGGAWEYLSLVRELKVWRSDKVLKNGLSILNDPKKRSTLGPDVTICKQSSMLNSTFIRMCQFLLMLLLGFGFCMHCSSTSTENRSCKSGNYIMESYFKNYEFMLEPTFRDFMSSGLHFGGCELLPNRPDLLLRLSVPRRNLIGEGSHRHLSSTIRLHFQPVSLAQLPNHFCKLLIIERLPSGVFADPFELQHLLQRGVFTDAAVFGDTNLELPSVRSNQSVVEIHMNLGPNIFLGQTNGVEIGLQLPLHARYPPLDESGYSKVEFGPPDLYMHCSIEGNLDNQSCLFMPAWSDIEYKTGNVIWRIPSGSKEHARMVSAVTFVTAFISAFLIVLASVYHSDGKFCRT